jgi:hypothetical protein
MNDEALEGLRQALQLVSEDEAKKVAFAVYGALSMGFTADDLTRLLVEEPQERHSAYMAGYGDAVRALRKADLVRTPFTVRVMRRINHWLER